MTESPKKISFGFTKSKPVYQKKVPISNDIQYIECLDSKAIKIKGEVASQEKKELIIPLNNNKTLVSHDDLKAENKTCGNASSDNSDKQGPVETLEALAVREILEESQKVKESEEPKIFSVQLNSDKKAEDLEKESTLTDYENVPVKEFGLAMLRGMGWKPEKGIGKNERVVQPSVPVLRAKGMGLGAERKVLPPVPAVGVDELVLKKGCYVQVVAGSNKNMYGQVQSFDEDAGRVILKAALGGLSVSVNESMIKVVTKEEYIKSSRVLNLTKYEECRRQEEREMQHVDCNNGSMDYKRQKKQRSNETNGRIYRE